MATVFGFWRQLKHPIIGLSPMDGVTDFAWRQMVVKTSREQQKSQYPSVVMTEFVPVEALAHSALRVLQAFWYSPNERPIVAQVYGVEVAAFRTAAQIVAALGFDGLDINMGCPAKKVSRRGAGAALITNQKLAEQIIKSCKEGLQDWKKGLSIDDLDVKEKVKVWIKTERRRLGLDDEAPRELLPLSVKTRVGFEQIDIESWAKFLAKQELAAISLHGRTLKQLYRGVADWQAVALGAKIIKQNSDSLVLGNGDIDSLDTAQQKIKENGVDGVLIGRAAIGHPGVFADQTPTIEERKQQAIEHAKLHYQLLPPQAFPSFRRHLAHYISHLPHAADLRRQLMQASDPEAVEQILNQSQL